MSITVSKFGRFDIHMAIGGILIDNKNKPSTTEIMSDLLTGSLKFAKNRKRELYVYYDGVYHPADDDIKECHAQICKSLVIDWRRERYLELQEYLLIHAKELQYIPDANLINLKNGLYFIQEERFEYHSEVD